MLRIRGYGHRIARCVAPVKPKLQNIFHSLSLSLHNRSQNKQLTNSKFFSKNAKKGGGEYNQCARMHQCRAEASHQPQHHTAALPGREAKTHSPHFYSIFPDFPKHHRPTPAAAHQMPPESTRYAAKEPQRTALHSTAEQSREQNTPKPTEREGRARERRKMC